MALNQVTPVQTRWCAVSVMGLVRSKQKIRITESQEIATKSYDVG